MAPSKDCRKCENTNTTLLKVERNYIAKNPVGVVDNGSFNKTVENGGMENTLIHLNRCRIFFGPLYQNKIGLFSDMFIKIKSNFFGP